MGCQRARNDRQHPSRHTAADAAVTQKSAAPYGSPNPARGVSTAYEGEDHFDRGGAVSLVGGSSPDLDRSFGRIRGRKNTNPCYENVAFPELTFRLRNDAFAIVPVNPSPKPKPKAKDLLPTKALIDEVTFLRRNFREIINHYTVTVESEMAQIVALVTAESEKKMVPVDRMKEMRDMLMLLRGLEIKTSKGRWRDLKRIESLVAELRTIAERW